MDPDMHDENARLREQLRTLLLHARENEAKHSRLQQVELRLLEVDTISNLLDELLINYPDQSDLDNVTLVLLDPEYEIARLVEETGCPAPAGLLLLPDPGLLFQYYGAEPAIEMGEFIPDVHGEWFRGLEGTPASIALLPLSRRGQLMGSLNLASRHTDRFHRDYCSDFIEGLASIATVSLENILNQERLKRIGLTDTLTGLNNRRYFDQRLSEEVTRAIRHEQPLSVLFIDLDHFKAINDQHGHATGDRVLTELSLRLREHVRGQDVLARFGGEEFAALLVGDDLAAAMQVAERLRAGVEAMVFPVLDTHHLQVTVSVGVAELHTVAPSANEVDEVGRMLVAAADAALYSAKNSGRNRVAAGPVPTDPN